MWLEKVSSCRVVFWSDIVQEDSANFSGGHAPLLVVDGCIRVDIKCMAVLCGHGGHVAVFISIDGLLLRIGRYLPQPMSFWDGYDRGILRYGCGQVRTPPAGAAPSSIQVGQRIEFGC